MTDWEMEMATHVSPSGKVHLGQKPRCISEDCTPPLLNVREGDVVFMQMPDGSEGRYIVRSAAEPDQRDYVTLSIEVAE